MLQAILNVFAIIALVLVGGFIIYALVELILSVDGKRGTLFFRNRKNTARDNEILLEYNKNVDTNDSFYLQNESNKDLMLDFDKQYESELENQAVNSNVNMLKAEEERKLIEAKRKAESELQAQEEVVEPEVPAEPVKEVHSDFVFINTENPEKQQDVEELKDEVKEVPTFIEEDEEDEDDQSIEEILKSIQERNRNNRNRYLASLDEDDDEFENADEEDENLNIIKEINENTTTETAQEENNEEIDALHAKIAELEKALAEKESANLTEEITTETAQETEEVEETSEVEEVVEEVQEVEEVAEEANNEEIDALNAKIAELQAQIETEKAKAEEMNARAEEALNAKAELEKALAEKENTDVAEEITAEKLALYEEKLAELLERQKQNDKDLRINKKEYLPLARIEKTLESDKDKLRRKEAIVAKRKIVLFGVNNYVADPEKEKKLAEDLDMLEGLRLSVQHCEEVMNNNKDRYPVLKRTNDILTRNAAEIQNDIDEVQAKIAKAKEVLNSQDSGDNE